MHFIYCLCGSYRKWNPQQNQSEGPVASGAVEVREGVGGLEESRPKPTAVSHVI